MNTETKLIAVVCILGAAVLLWRDGYDRGRDLASCPEQNGRLVAYVTHHFDGRIECKYITHHKGLI